MPSVLDAEARVTLAEIEDARLALLGAYRAAGFPYVAVAARLAPQADGRPALILAVTGFIPGLALSYLLYDFVGSATFLPLRLDFSMGLSVFLMIFAMCAVAGLLAVRKLRDANPADMF